MVGGAAVAGEAEGGFAAEACAGGFVRGVRFEGGGIAFLRWPLRGGVGSRDSGLCACVGFFVRGRLCGDGVSIASRTGTAPARR